eukprot:351174-Chlamydomonas_euryale.AAC.2
MCPHECRATSCNTGCRVRTGPAVDVRAWVPAGRPVATPDAWFGRGLQSMCAHGCQPGGQCKTGVPT